jgi:hypothetical protein
MAKPKLKLGYDNYEDAKTKLNGTFCLYKGKAFTVKTVGYKDDNPGLNKFVVVGSFMEGGGRTTTSLIDLDDPHFNCSDYSIGYMNLLDHGFAAWFQRIPYKQYQQGLRPNQLNAKASNPAYLNIEVRHGKWLGSMLENDYPKFKMAADMLGNADLSLVAFHRNFAMSKDNIHKDYILEYKGQEIGFTPDLKNFKLLHEHEHLYEALKEAVG